MSDKAIRKLVSTGAELQFVYEAGPCGFGLCRHLAGNGFSFIVAASSMIPKKSGVRNKNDNRDAIALVRQLRAGEIIPVYVPDPEDEAMPDLIRNNLSVLFVALTRGVLWLSPICSYAIYQQFYRSRQFYIHRNIFTLPG